MKRIDENHSFNVNVCKILKGHCQKAILLKEIYGWCHINKAKNHNIKFGLAWTYMSAAGFSEKFEYMSPSSIDRWLRELEKDGWLFSARLNKKGFDKTKWYTSNFERYDDAVLKIEHSINQIDEWKNQIDESINQNSELINQFDEPIPPTTTTETTSSSSNIGVYKSDTPENEIEDLKKEIESLKSDLKKERKSSAKKKEKKAGQHQFPSNEGKKKYNKNDKRMNKKLPFDVISAKGTLQALFPDNEELKHQYNEIFRNFQASDEVLEHCRTSFIEIGISNYYPGIRDIVLLQRNFFEWIKKEVIFRKRQKNNSKTSSQVSIMVDENCGDRNNF